MFASGEDGGQQYIAFEYVTGTNVRDLIQQRRMLTPGETVNYLLQMADALRHTSAAGVVHRDIKPSNIIITPSGGPSWSTWSGPASDAERSDGPRDHTGNL